MYMNYALYRGHETCRRPPDFWSCYTPISPELAAKRCYLTPHCPLLPRASRNRFSWLMTSIITESYINLLFYGLRRRLLHARLHHLLPLYLTLRHVE